MWLAARDTVAGAMRTLGAHKLRSALTLLGIVIGVVAVTSMAATIEGLRRQIDADLSQLGSGVFQVQQRPMGRGGNPRARARWEKRKPFTLADVELLQEKCASCFKVGGEAWAGQQTVHGPGQTAAHGVHVAGGTIEFFENNGFAVAQGRLFNEGELARAAEVAVLGSDLAESLFPAQNPIGEQVTVQGRRLRVVGVLERRGASMDGSIDSLVVMPLTRFLRETGEKQSLNLTIMARDPKRIAAVQDEVVALLRRTRGVPNNAENDFEMFSNASVQESFREIAGYVAAASIGVCAISLLIGGIGVMNIMLVAVSERTSEIGVRRALGARRRRILGQFVVEAVTLCLLGGVFGVLLGGFAAWLVKVLVPLPTVMPAWAIALSLGAAGGVGLVFGIYPAWRASRLDPVEAMRHE
jgi:putative ABC transport system permease protein